MTDVESLCSYRAKLLIDEGLDEVYEGNYQAALNHFQRSIDSNKSAKAYTYCGWMYSTLGNKETAIKYWYKAIEVDPKFGTPYNDIGSSLMVEGKLTEAVYWFHRALDAEDYDSPQFPHVNLGKLYLEKKLYKEALHHFRQALEFDPENKLLETMILDFEEKLS